jgi:hypothetical protein
MLLRKQKASEEMEHARQFREASREKAYQDLVIATVQSQVSIQDRFSRSEEIQSNILQSLTVVIERLSAVTGSIKESLNDIKDTTDASKEVLDIMNARNKDE